MEGHDAHLAQNTDDMTWLRYASSKRWVCVSADKAMRWNYVEVEAIYRSKAALFLLRFHDGRRAEDLGKALVKAQRRMQKILESERRPFIATVTLGGDVAMRMRPPDIRERLQRLERQALGRASTFASSS